jgi:hypothetical protein
MDTRTGMGQMDVGKRMAEPYAGYCAAHQRATEAIKDLAAAKGNSRLHILARVFRTRYRFANCLFFFLSLRRSNADRPMIVARARQSVCARRRRQERIRHVASRTPLAARMFALLLLFVCLTIFFVSFRN